MVPLVSIVVPTFNAERYLEATVGSVREQTVKDWELWLSDDGSSDGTVEIARKFQAADARVHVIENPPARHPGPTRNAGMARASGRYLAFLDSDDLWLPNKLERQLEAIGALSEPGICYTPAEDFSDEAGTPARRTYQRAPPPDRESQYRRALLTTSEALTSSWLMEREFAEEIGPFTEHPLLAGYEDWDYLLRSLWRRAMVFVPERLIRYRVHRESITTRNLGDWERRFEIYRQVEARGQMPEDLKRRCWSSAWLLRAEIELDTDQPGWRSSFLKALALDRWNWRRWLPGLGLVFGRPIMGRYYRALKRFQGAVEGR